jgi:hypothetical protein
LEKVRRTSWKEPPLLRDGELHCLDRLWQWRTEVPKMVNINMRVLEEESVRGYMYPSGPVSIRTWEVSAEAVEATMKGCVYINNK